MVFLLISCSLSCGVLTHILFIELWRAYSHSFHWVVASLLTFFSLSCGELTHILFIELWRAYSHPFHWVVANLLTFFSLSASSIGSMILLRNKISKYLIFPFKNLTKVSKSQGNWDKARGRLNKIINGRMYKNCSPSCCNFYCKPFQFYTIYYKLLITNDVR